MESEYVCSSNTYYLMQFINTLLNTLKLNTLLLFSTMLQRIMKTFLVFHNSTSFIVKYKHISKIYFYNKNLIVF